MAQNNRTKEVWLIPKRVSLHQTICLIDGIIKRDYNNKTWTPQRQNDLGVNLKNWGATNDGRNISNQSVRTLVASIPQYLGFVYINTNTTPNSICLTEAGMALWNKHKDELVKIPNLRDGSDNLITESEIVLKQMEKLQITNPIIQKDCENIYVFPFRFMLRVLLEVNYLDQEEIAYFLFQVHAEDELQVIIQEIKNFRKLSNDERTSLMNAFRRTHIGNITLVQASSASYFMSLCQITGIIDKFKYMPNNYDKQLSALKINNDYKQYVRDMLLKFNSIETYDFKNNLQLWIDYIGNPKRPYPPIAVTIENNNNMSYLIKVLQNGKLRNDNNFELINEQESIQFPMFVNEKYDVEIINIENGKVLNTQTIIPTFEENIFELNVSNKTTDKVISLNDIKIEIIEHCNSRTFTNTVLNYLKVLFLHTGIDRRNDIALRGAYLEYYMYSYLSKLNALNVIDDVLWNGKIGKYGLPVHAPGGRTGTPDIIFYINNYKFILELTTIKSKSLQFQAEGASVPDHIKLSLKVNEGFNVHGLFVAPSIYERNTQTMKASLQGCNVGLSCIKINDFLSSFESLDKNKIISSLISF